MGYTGLDRRSSNDSHRKTLNQTNSVAQFLHHFQWLLGHGDSNLLLGINSKYTTGTRSDFWRTHTLTMLPLISIYMARCHQLPIPNHKVKQTILLVSSQIYVNYAGPATTISQVVLPSCQRVNNSGINHIQITELSTFSIHRLPPVPSMFFFILM